MQQIDSQAIVGRIMASPLAQRSRGLAHRSGSTSSGLAKGLRCIGSNRQSCFDDADGDRAIDLRSRSFHGHSGFS